MCRLAGPEVTSRLQVNGAAGASIKTRINAAETEHAGHGKIWALSPVQILD